MRDPDQNPPKRNQQSRNVVIHDMRTQVPLIPAIPAPWRVQLPPRSAPRVRPCSCPSIEALICVGNASYSTKRPNLAFNRKITRRRSGSRTRSNSVEMPLNARTLNPCVTAEMNRKHQGAACSKRPGDHYNRDGGRLRARVISESASRSAR